MWWLTKRRIILFIFTDYWSSRLIE